ncbi:hypothetical protein [Aporhodopirellula aestuarii]|uniref:Uncharacterized protein n=1 Tax=Aporhodopirellula aestuarii TaxID=2950107 RepID=A0ABT0U440_9BACT|nr:hypothetical protein [Aporhodopirellula aestuarii]MCM2371667.1 hypothetical protein [Aporhodopirellula aestuarii]
MTTQKSYTQFIPMMFGIPMLFLGVVALNPHRRGESVFVALLLSAAGMLLGCGRFVVLLFAWFAGEHVNLLSVQLVAAMALICGVFVIVAERWRRIRRRSELACKLALKNSSSVESATAAAANVDLSEPVTRARADNENPYQTPAIISEPAPAPSSKLTDHTTK